MNLHIGKPGNVTGTYVLQSHFWLRLNCFVTAAVQWFWLNDKLKYYHVCATEIENCQKLAKLN